MITICTNSFIAMYHQIFTNLGLCNVQNLVYQIWLLLGEGRHYLWALLSTWPTNTWTPHDLVWHASNMDCHMLCNVSGHKTSFPDLLPSRFCLFATMCGFLCGFSVRVWCLGEALHRRWWGMAPLLARFVCHGWADVRHCLLARIHGWNKVSIVLVVFCLQLLFSLDNQWFRVSLVVV